jgi:hypothetical protein
LAKPALRGGKQPDVFVLHCFELQDAGHTSRPDPGQHRKRQNPLTDQGQQLYPHEDRKHFTRVTEGSFYNYGTKDLKNKLICLEDLDGMREEAYLAFRELQIVA